MENIIIIAIVLVIVAIAARYVYRAKKSGRACIGCPDGGCACSGKNDEKTSCGCGCCGGTES